MAECDECGRETLDYEDHHRVALARELTYEAGVPLRDRYGFAANDRAVLAVLTAVATHPDDMAAAEEFGCANALGDIELAMGYDTPTDEDYEVRIAAAVRPLIEQRRDAAVRSQKG